MEPPVDIAQKRIIFIHGLRGPNEPPPLPKDEYLREWREALRHSLWVNIPDQASCMAYWADLRPDPKVLQKPKVSAALAREHLHLRGPHAHSTVRPDKLFFWIRALVITFVLYRFLRLVRWASPLITEIERRWLEDYYLYFRVNGFRDEIRGRLEAELDAAAQEGQRVAIVAHSMGTVIAYDALQKDPGYVVDLLVTMGSPLGLTAVQIDLTNDTPGHPNGYAHPPFPPNVHRWLNVFDGIDAVTLPDQRLANDFTDRRVVLVADHMIRANVDDKGNRDPHHWHGYLSSEDVGDAVSKFWVDP